MKAFAPGSLRWKEESRRSAAGWLLAVIAVLLVCGIALGAWMRLVALYSVDYRPELPLTPSGEAVAQRWGFAATTMRGLMFEAMALARLSFGWHCLQAGLLLPLWWWARRAPWPALLCGVAVWLLLEGALLRADPMNFARFRWIAALTAVTWLLALRAAWRQRREERAAVALSR